MMRFPMVTSAQSFEESFFLQRKTLFVKSVARCTEGQ